MARRAGRITLAAVIGAFALLLPTTAGAQDPWAECARGESRDCRGASLSGRDLSNTKFVGVDLRNAHLRGADLSNAHFLSSDLYLADLSRAKLDGTVFERSKAQRADFTEAAGEAPRFVNTLLGRAPLPSLARLGAARFDGSALPGAQFTKADLDGVRFDEARLPSAVFERSSMNETNLRAAALHGAAFEGIKSRSTRFGSAKLVGSRFARSHFENSDFADANLEDARISDSSFYRSSLNRASLRQAQVNPDTYFQAAGVTGTDVRGSTILTHPQLRNQFFERVRGRAVADAGGCERDERSIDCDGFSNAEDATPPFQQGVRFSWTREPVDGDRHRMRITGADGAQLAGYASPGFRAFEVLEVDNIHGLWKSGGAGEPGEAGAPLEIDRERKDATEEGPRWQLSFRGWIQRTGRVPG